MRAVSSTALLHLSDTPAQDIRNPRYPVMPLQNAVTNTKFSRSDFTATASSLSLKSFFLGGQVGTRALFHRRSG